METLQVDFEGRAAADCDRDGIIQLLTRGVFKNAPIDVGSLADVIISQNYVGSVLKQALDDYEDDSDDEEVNYVFGLTTVINLRTRDEYPVLEALQNLLLDLVTAHGTPLQAEQIKDMLEQINDHPMGLVINERMSNISHLVAAPMFSTLLEDMKKAKRYGMMYDFSYYLMICKVMEDETNVDPDGDKLVWCHAEEEKALEHALMALDFTVTNSWDKDDEQDGIRLKLMLFASPSFMDFIANLVK